MSYPLMRKATAVWLLDNTTLTFRQIAEFCGLHELEVNGIADGEVASGIRAIDPIINNQITMEEIKRCEKDAAANLVLFKNPAADGEKRTKGPKYTPLSKKQDKPDSALWLIRHHSILKDSQIAKLVGITKNSVVAIRNKSYWNYNNLNPKDPVAMGLFSQKELIESTEKAERRIKREKREKEKAKEAQ